MGKDTVMDCEDLLRKISEYVDFIFIDNGDFDHALRDTREICES